MDLMQSTDQDAIQQTVRSFLEKELPLSRVRELDETGGDGLARVWAAAGALGFFGLGLDETHGGAGYSLTEEMILFEELGRALAPGPWLGSALAAHALAGAGGNEAAELRRKILAGETRVALIERHERPGLELGSGRLNGVATRVPDAAGADGVLVLGPAGALYLPVNPGTVSVDPRPSMDPTRHVANVSFQKARPTVLDDDPAVVELLRRQATVLACAEAVGGIQRTVDMSVEYAKVRHQFGKPIGSFQAVKHRCADMAVRAEVARSATIYATIAVRDNDPDRDFFASAAKVLCANAYIQNAADNVQNHGGMGFTWECDAHLYVKRARSFDQTLGSRQRHLDSIVAEIRAAG